MKNSFSLLLLLLTFSANIFAQKNKELKTKFGKLSSEEIAMKTYAPEPMAAAIILFDKCEVRNNYQNNIGFVQTYERHTRIKIFKKDAYDIANGRIILYNDTKLTDLKAVCYTFEGGKTVETKMESENVFEEKLTKNIAVQKFVIPGVQEGCIIEFKYSLRTENAIFIQDWTFQSEYPTIWSEYDAEVPLFFTFQKMTQGYTDYSFAKEEVATKSATLTFNTSEVTSDGLSAKNMSVLKLNYEVKKMRFIQENIPAFKKEKYILSSKDYLSKIMFDVSVVYDTDLIPQGDSYKLVNGLPKIYDRSWEGRGKELYKGYYEEIVKNSRPTDGEIKKMGTISGEAKEKVAAVYEYIGKNYEVRNYDYFAMSQPMKELITKHKGTPTDLNLLFINLLKQLDVKAYPVLLSTRSHGRLHPAFADVASFDRIIVAVALDDKNETLIDMGEYPLPVGLLPYEDLNDQGLVMRSKDDAAFVPLVNRILSKKACSTDLKVTDKGVIEGNMTFSCSGYEAQNLRKSFIVNGEKKIASLLLPDIDKANAIVSQKYEQLDKPKETNVKAVFQIKTSDFSSVSGNKIYFTPTVGLGFKENLFKETERKLDINIGVPEESIYVLTYKIPVGYKIEEAPKPARLKFGESELAFDYLVDVFPESIKVTVKYKQKNTAFEVLEYADLKKFFGEIVAKTKEQVVLVKI